MKKEKRQERKKENGGYCVGAVFSGSAVVSQLTCFALVRAKRSAHGLKSYWFCVVGVEKRESEKGWKFQGYRFVMNV